MTRRTLWPPYWGWTTVSIRWWYCKGQLAKISFSHAWRRCFLPVFNNRNDVLTKWNTFLTNIFLAFIWQMFWQIYLNAYFFFPLTGSSDFLLEGDVMIPKTRTAMKCLNEPYSCLWPKSANSNVEIAFLISPKYGRLHSFKVAHNWNWILPVYVCITLCYWFFTFIHDCRQQWEDYNSECLEGLWIENLRSFHSMGRSEDVCEHWAKIWVSL